MNYILPESSFGIMDADMARKTPEEMAEIGRQAADLALARIPAIEDTVPADFTPHQRRVYIATAQTMKRPGGIQGAGTHASAEQKPRSRGLLAGLFHG